MDTDAGTDASRAATRSTNGTPIACPRCGTSVIAVVGLGPTTRRAAPCGCRVSGAVLERAGDESA